jgi:hypothetical protein
MHRPVFGHPDVAMCHLLQMLSVDLQWLARAPMVKRTTRCTPTPRLDLPCHVRSCPTRSQHLTGRATTPRPNAQASESGHFQRAPRASILRLDASGESQSDIALETDRSLLATCLRQACATTSANNTNEDLSLVWQSSRNPL